MAGPPDGVREVQWAILESVDRLTHPLLLPLAGDEGVIDRLVIAQLYPSDAPRLPYGGA